MDLFPRSTESDDGAGLYPGGLSLPAHFLFLGVCFYLTIQSFLASTWDINRPADFFTATSGSGSANAQIAFVLLGGYGVFGLWKYSRLKLQPSGIPGLFSILLFVWTLFSVTWSTSPKSSIARLAGIVGLVLAALTVRRAFNRTQIITGITLGTFLYALIGLASELVLQTLRPWEVDYRFSGTLHPNAQGVNCSIAFAGAFWLAKSGIRRRFYYALAAFMFVLDVMTKSRTALGSIVIALLIVGVATQPRGLRKQLGLMVVCTLLLLGTWVQVNNLLSTSSALQLGRDQSTSDNSSLTGRLPLWTELLGMTKSHEFAGFGFGAFWTEKNIQQVSDDQGWGISAAHSAYVDMILAVGPFGLFLYMGTLFFGTFCALRCSGDKCQLGARFFSTILIFVVIDGVTDSEPVIVSAFLCFCFILTLVEVTFHGRRLEARST